MKELSIEDMTSLQGGFRDRNRATVIASNNTAVSVNAAIGAGNRSGGVTQYADANAGNQSVSITQSN